MSVLYRPQLLYTASGFVSGTDLLVDDQGSIVQVGVNVDAGEATVVELPGKALLPGMVNAHSHSFQRLIRAKSETRQSGDFWAWRDVMYRAASVISSAEVFDVARMAFLEMLRSGITTVGEFHYLHNREDGQPYDDPNSLSKAVIAAARAVGIRIVLLRTAYLRSGFELDRDPRQARFFETGRQFLENAEALLEYSATAAANRDAGLAQVGVAPHSIRAVPFGELQEIFSWSAQKRLPVHMHLSEQIAENIACRKEYGVTPATLLAREKLLNPAFTAVHAIHLEDEELSMLAESGTTICSCPTTERNLGDGIFPADSAAARGIPIALGSDSQAQIDLLEDARELEYHLRLRDQQRAVFQPVEDETLADTLFQCVTAQGARSLGVTAGALTRGLSADFFTVDLNALSIVGSADQDLIANIVFSLDKSAICDVAVKGKLVVRDKQHTSEREIVERYREVHRRIWHK